MLENCGIGSQLTLDLLERNENYHGISLSLNSADTLPAHPSPISSYTRDSNTVYSNQILLCLTTKKVRVELYHSGCYVDRDSTIVSSIYH